MFFRERYYDDIAHAEYFDLMPRTDLAVSSIDIRESLAKKTQAQRFGSISNTLAQARKQPLSGTAAFIASAIRVVRAT